MDKVHVEVLRPFYHDGEPQPAGTVLEVAPNVARELVAWNKAAIVTGDAPKKGKTKAKATDAPTDEKDEK